MADIIIKNMEMPKEGVLNLLIYPDGDVLRVDPYKLSEVVCSTNAKAIELPPHNDLADKSVIIERMGDAHDELWDKVDEKALSECHVAFLKAVMYAPTVLEAST